MSRKRKIINASILVVMLGLIGWGCYYFHLHQTELQIQKREQLKNENKLTIGGFKFGMTQQEVINVAQSLNYSIEESPYHIIISGEISALGIVWDFADLLVKERGLVQIGLTTKASELSEEMIQKCLSDFHQLFPRSQAPKENLIQSITIGGKTVPLLSDYVGLVDIEEENPDYQGGIFCLRDEDRFNCLINWIK